MRNTKNINITQAEAQKTLDAMRNVKDQAKMDSMKILAANKIADEEKRKLQNKIDIRRRNRDFTGDEIVDIAINSFSHSDKNFTEKVVNLLKNSVHNLDGKDLAQITTIGRNDEIKVTAFYLGYSKNIFGASDYIKIMHLSILDRISELAFEKMLEKGFFTKEVYNEISILTFVCPKVKSKVTAEAIKKGYENPQKPVNSKVEEIKEYWRKKFNS